MGILPGHAVGSIGGNVRHCHRLVAAHAESLTISGLSLLRELAQADDRMFQRTTAAGTPGTLRVRWSYGSKVQENEIQG